MKMLGSTKNKITKDKDGQNKPHLEITEAVLVYLNIVNIYILYTIIPNIYLVNYQTFY